MGAGKGKNRRASGLQPKLEASGLQPRLEASGLQPGLGAQTVVAVPAAVKGGWLEQALLILDINDDGRAHQYRKLIDFIGSDACPEELRQSALERAKFIVENDEAYEEYQLSDEDSLTYEQDNFFFSSLGLEGTYDVLATAPNVSPANREKIRETTQQIRDKLVRANLLPTSVDPIIVPMTTEIPLSLHLSHANLILISELLLDSHEQFMEKVIAHELIHGNEKTRDLHQESDLNDELFPQISFEQTSFLREGLVDWLANNYVMGSPTSHPAPYGPITIARMKQYAPNIAFVEENIVPHLKAKMKEGEVLAEKVAALLRNKPGETMLLTALPAVPGLASKLGIIEGVTKQGILKA